MEASEVVLRAPANQLQDLAACASKNPVFVFHLKERFFTLLPRLSFMTIYILHAIADRLLVNVQSDVVHTLHEEPPR